MGGLAVPFACPFPHVVARWVADATRACSKTNSGRETPSCGRWHGQDPARRGDGRFRGSPGRRSSEKAPGRHGAGAGTQGESVGAPEGVGSACRREAASRGTAPCAGLRAGLGDAQVDGSCPGSPVPSLSSSTYAVCGGVKGGGGKHVGTFCGKTQVWGRSRGQNPLRS